MFHQGWGRFAPLARSSLASDPMRANRISYPREEDLPARNELVISRNEQQRHFGFHRLIPATGWPKGWNAANNFRGSLRVPADIPVLLPLPARTSGFSTRGSLDRSRNWLRFVLSVHPKIALLSQTLYSRAKSPLIFFLSPVSYLFHNFDNFVFFSVNCVYISLFLLYVFFVYISIHVF